VKICRNQALKLRAKQDLVDQKGVERLTNEQWLVTDLGSYMPGPYEENLGIVPALILTTSTAVLLKATKNMVDRFGKKRNAGEVWLVTNK